MDVEDLVLIIAEGNPGAATLCMRLMHRARWFEIMQYLSAHGPRGSKLWELYKDVFEEDIFKFGDCLEFRMRAAKNECLPSISIEELAAQKLCKL